MNNETLDYSYQLRFPDKKTITLALQIESQTATLIANNENTPFWAALQFNQCSNCPLNAVQHPVCPVAQNLIPLFNLSDSLVSYEQVYVVVTTPDRTVSAETTVQRAISSMLGLIMATSPCPHTEYLKPMARFHLPFASEDETVYRTTSMYLLAQYFRKQQGMDFESGFKALTDVYANLQIINRAMANRFRAAIKEDATVNAIILLDLLSQAVTWSIEDQLEELKPLFSRFLV